MSKVVISEEVTKNPFAFSKPPEELTDEELLTELTAFRGLRGSYTTKARSGATKKKEKEVKAAQAITFDGF